MRMTTKEGVWGVCKSKTGPTVGSMQPLSMGMRMSMGPATKKNAVIEMKQEANVNRTSSSSKIRDWL